MKVNEWCGCGAGYKFEQNSPSVNQVQKGREAAEKWRAEHVCDRRTSKPVAMGFQP